MEEKKKDLSGVLKNLLNQSVKGEKNLRELEKVINGVDQTKFRQIIHLVKELGDELLNYLPISSEEEREEIKRAQHELYNDLVLDLDEVIDSNSLCKKRDELIDKIRGRNSSQPSLL